MSDKVTQAGRKQLSSQQRRKSAEKVTLIGALVNIVLAVVKIVVGTYGKSEALIADGIHSFADLLSDLIVLIASRHGSEDADDAHPYGHARIETVAAVVLGVLLLLVGVGIGYDASLRLMSPETLMIPEQIALVVAVISVFSKELLYRYTMQVARAIRSKLLEANAWHHRSDAFSSIVVLIGVGGSMLGFTVLDALAAIGVALMIGKIGWDLVSQGVSELIDTALEEDRIEAIEALITSVPGVKSIHMLRTRRMGVDALADVHVQVSPRLSVSEGHQISETVRNRLISEIEELSDVTVHIDPEDDEIAAPCAGLPTSEEVKAELKDRWSTCDCIPVEEMVLHFLNGEVNVDIVLALRYAGNDQVLQDSRALLASCASRLEYIGMVKFYYH